MKKLTAGIFTVMLGLVAVDANAAITSQKYVDDAIKGVNSTITTEVSNINKNIQTVEGNVTNLTEQVNNLVAEEGEGSIAQQIADAVKPTADALDEYKTSNDKALADEVAARKDADTTINTTIGDKATLTTTNKDSIVGAINSVQTTVNTHDTNITELTTKVTNLESGSGLGEGAVKEDAIEDGAVTTDKIATDAVTQDKIADKAVGTDQIQDGAVTTEKLANVEGLTAMEGATKVSVNAKGQITKAEKAVLADLTNVPTNCTVAGAECVLKYSPASQSFAWEDIANTYSASTPEVTE